jgi:HK97 family phage major capsid protein
MRAASVARFKLLHGEILMSIPLESQPPFRNLAEQLLAVMEAANSSKRDPRLLGVQQRAEIAFREERAARGAAAGGSEMVPSDGGFLVAPEFTRDIMKRVYLTGDIIARCLRVPVSSSSYKFPQIDESSRVSGSRLGGVQVYAEEEGANILPASLQSTSASMKPTFNQPTVAVNKITGLLRITDELARDTAAFDTWASYAFSQELRFKLETYIVNGTGAGTPLGIMKSGALITTPIQLGQATHSIVNQNVIAMLQNLWPPSMKNACWLYNNDVLPSLLQLQNVVGTAGSQSNLFHFAEDEGETNRLCGIPAFPSEYCQAAGTPGDLILADFSRYVLAIREFIRGEVSIHVLFVSDESLFRFVMRVGGEPIDPRPVTPANGSSQTSTYVALAAR